MHILIEGYDSLSTTELYIWCVVFCVLFSIYCSLLFKFILAYTTRHTILHMWSKPKLLIYYIIIILALIIPIVFTALMVVDSFYALERK